MCPVPTQIGPLPAWAAVVMMVALAAAALLIERGEQRRLGLWPNWPRVGALAAVAALVGGALWLGLNRWGHSRYAPGGPR